jgi:hypothetical protein
MSSDVKGSSRLLLPVSTPRNALLKKQPSRRELVAKQLIHKESAQLRVDLEKKSFLQACLVYL